MDKRKADPFECLDDPPRRRQAEKMPADLFGVEPDYRARLQTRLIIDGDTFMATARPMPNAWRRFWLWALLGWRWEKIG